MSKRDKSLSLLDLNFTGVLDTIMNLSEFSDVVDDIYTRIEDIIDELIDNGHELDYENTGGVLTIDCEDTHTKVIVSRQQATQQIWVAAKSGGFHCHFDEGQWRCTTTQETLEQLLSRVCSEQLNQAVSFPL